MSKKISPKKYYKLQAELLGSGLSPRALILYSVLADRAELSKTGTKFKDATGYYIIYPVADICELLHIGERTARYALAELEDAGLLTTRKQGKGLPQKLYIHAISDRQKTAGQDRQDSAALDRQKTAGQDRQDSAALNSSTDIIYTDIASLPALMQMIAEVAAERDQTLTPKQGLKLAKKVIAAKPRSPRAWIRTVLPSAVKDIDEYEATYDIAEYAASSILDEWDE